MVEYDGFLFGVSGRFGMMSAQMRVSEWKYLFLFWWIGIILHLLWLMSSSGMKISNLSSAFPLSLTLTLFL
jgi:hypothetical protein